MFDALPVAVDLAWPLAVAFAWLLGELAQRWNIPRIASYALVGFLFAPAQLASLPAGGGPTGALLANTAFGLILFEFGYRINLHWFRQNPWIAATGLLDVALSFLAVYALSRVMGAAVLTSLLLASIATATSPASLTRVVNDLRSSGQVTERALHLSAVNCLCAVFAFKFIVGFWTFDTAGDAVKALSNSAVVVLVSMALGVAFGSGMPPVLRLVGRYQSDATVAFAIGVVLLVALTHLLHLSALVATLAFGLVARHRRVTLSQAQRNFGVLGDLLIVFLFVYVGASADWRRAWAGLPLGAALVLVRAAAKVLAMSAFARASGTTLRKGMLTALAMMPLSTFVVLLLEDTRHVGIDLIDTVAPVAAATLLLQLLGPIATQQALRAAGEVQDAQPGKTRE
jgi:Kef-type K+ transport system membrane component KefB